MTIPYSTQTIDQQDIRAVVEVLKSEWLTTGPMVEKFEAVVAKYVGAKYAVAVANGTAALHVACLAAGIRSGDEVIVPDYTFAATANCVLYCGGKPVLVDIDETNLCIDIKAAEEKINQKTKAIIAVDFGGQAADWRALLRLARKHKLILIDDAAHSLGAKYDGKNIGTQADLFFFSPSKNNYHR
jgi:perosamine synthetase